MFRDLQPVESLVISHIQVRDRTSRGTPHMGHADVMKLPLCCLGCWGDMAPRSPQLRICAGAQEGSLGKQTNLPISTDWELGALLVHTYEGCGAAVGPGGRSVGTMGYSTAQQNHARSILSQSFPRRGACTWGQPAGSCRCPWPPAPGTPHAMTASSPGTPTVPGMAGHAAPLPPQTGRDGLPVPRRVPMNLPLTPSHAVLHHPVAQLSQSQPQRSGM